VIVNRGLSSCTCESLVLLLRYVHFGARVELALSQSEVDQVHCVRPFVSAHQEIVRFGVSVDEVMGVDGLHASDHLVRQHQDGLERELLLAKAEDVLERGTQHVHDHLVVVPLRTLLLDLGDTRLFLDVFVDLLLLVQLRIFSFLRFQFYGHQGLGICIST